MKYWIVTRIADSKEVYRYPAEDKVEWVGFEFATHTHTEAPAEPSPPPAPTAPRRVTKLAFRQRFSRTEKAGIELAAVDNPAAITQQRQMAAALRADLADQAQATFIDLNRPDTRAGVQALETLGLIAPGRAAEILDAPIQDSEAWHG